MDVLIRDAELNDISALAALGAATFAGTFAPLYKPENLKAYLAANHSEGYYARALADPKIKIFVVQHGKVLIGYCKLGPNTLPCDPPRPGALELSRIYMLASQRSKGAGHKLMNHIMSYATAHGFGEIVLGVFSENYDGHRFYERYGFSKIGEYNFPVGDDVDREWILCKTLA